MFRCAIVCNGDFQECLRILAFGCIPFRGGCTSSRLRVVYVLFISAGVWFVWSQNGQAVTNSDASAASLEGFQAVIKSAASAASPDPKFVQKYARFVVFFYKDGFSYRDLSELPSHSCRQSACIRWLQPQLPCHLSGCGSCFASWLCY